MGARGNGLTLEGLAQRLETLERENTELRDEVAELRGSGTRRDEVAETRSLVPLRDGERASGFEERVSRRALLTKAGAAAAAVAVGTLLMPPREAKAATVTGSGSPGVHGIGTINGNNGVLGELKAGVPNGDGVVGRGRGSTFAGVYGVNGGGFGVQGLGDTGVEGTGVNGVVGVGNKDGFSGVYGRHNGSTVGPGVTGDGRGNWPGVWGRNPTADGVTGETQANGFSGVFGRHLGPSGVSGQGVTGIGKGANGFGVVGKVFDAGGTGVYGECEGGYGGWFRGGKAQLRLTPGATAGRPTTGSHDKGELYMDSNANLFVCVADGAPGTWKRFTTN